jgi:hypothetical protein
MSDFPWSPLLDALVRVEELPADDSGLLSFGQPPGSGGIFVERGRICWAAARGLRRRLSDLLRESTGLSAAELDSVYERCRIEGKHFGHVLIAEGKIQPRELETALRLHSAESLVELCRGHEPTVWARHSGRGYSPHFTFRPLEVLFDVIALALPSLQGSARMTLSALDAPGRRGAAFVHGAGDPIIPVGAFGEGTTVAGLRAIGRWAHAVPRATKELGDAPSFTLAASTSGDTLAVWWRGAVLYVVVCADRNDVAAITSHLLAGG